jgi:hypothetical protein
MDINEALRIFEAAEANLVKLERVFKEARALTPDGICFGGNGEYEDRVRVYSEILAALPPIDGWKPTSIPIDLNDLARLRVDVLELGEPSEMFAPDDEVEKPARELAEYRHKLNSKRRPLIRRALVSLIDEVDGLVGDLAVWDTPSKEVNEKVSGKLWETLIDRIRSIDLLLGSSLPRPQGWGYLQRHLHFGMITDLRDIVENDWPGVRKGLTTNLYADDEPLPVHTDDLGALAATHPAGPVVSRLKWEVLSDDDFERLMFSLISSTKGYQNPEWLTRTNAPDRGRDLSVMRVTEDSLSGTTRRRVIIQCKHWLSKSVSLADVSTLRDQMSLWKSPKVDVLVIATSGRFTTDAVELIEQHNNGDRALQIEMWPESHLEMLLAKRPDLAAQFSLR